jgi:alpha-L-arabinofuranosidase
MIFRGGYAMKLYVDTGREIGKPSPMIYGHFLEHFHRQVYGGVFDPTHPLADEDGFRTDVLDVLKKIKLPILRWPGGCFVSSYHWQGGIGKDRAAVFDKAWRVEDSNAFGTDEFIRLCRKLNCEPYICTNAGTGSPEEMSDWLEYCNLKSEGAFARQRAANGFAEPHNVKYWSIGNENYGSWELGAKEAEEWGRLVCEASKLMKHVDPSIELSAAALTDIDWNISLLRKAANNLHWISIHQYWDAIHNTNALATYGQTMAYTEDLGGSIAKVRGLLTAMGLEKQIKIAFDEWNLRGWYHPNMHTRTMGRTKEEYLLPRDKNDINSSYTMADAVFSACFLNECNRNCDMVGMANFAPVVNTRGCIFTHPGGIVLRTTYHVFDLYVNHLRDTVVDAYCEGMPKAVFANKEQRDIQVDQADIIATTDADKTLVTLAAVNKSVDSTLPIQTAVDRVPVSGYRIHTLAGSACDSYNDIAHCGAAIVSSEWMDGDTVILPPHSVNIIHLRH